MKAVQQKPNREERILENQVKGNEVNFPQVREGP